MRNSGQLPALTQTPHHFLRKMCPACRSIVTELDLVLGADESGLFMEHPWCGFKGRNARRPSLGVVYGKLAFDE